MKLAFVINDIQTEKENYTTLRLARLALAMKHEVALVGLGDFIYQTSEQVCAMATVPKQDNFADDASLLAYLHSAECPVKKVVLSEYDVVLLRSDPADEVHTRPWAPGSALLFAQLLVKQGVLVLNDPSHLMDASNKTYFQTYPEIVRPKTAIARDAESLTRVVHEFGGNAVIKPLQGSGGQGVFILHDDAESNLNQIIEATVRDGYAIVQEYLPAAADGDLRLITLNGRPLQIDGVYACFRRYNDSDDERSNVSAGGKFELAEPTDAALRIAFAIGPKLIKDGMYLTGLDIVGDKMIEINVDTPGGINFASDLTGKDFCTAILQDLERKVALRRLYGSSLSVRELATM